MNLKSQTRLRLKQRDFLTIHFAWIYSYFLRMIFLANLVIYFCFTTAHTHNLLHTRSTAQPHRQLTTTTLTHKSQDIYFVQGQENTKTRKPLICLQKLINSSLMKLKLQTRWRSDSAIFYVSFRLNLKQFFPNDSLVYDVFGLFQCILSKKSQDIYVVQRHAKQEKS